MMETAISDLRALVHGEVRQTGNVYVGHCLHNLLDRLKQSPKDAPDSLEGLLFETLKFKDGNMCAINCRTLALCFVRFYKSRSLPFWGFVGTMTEEVEMFRVPAIVVLGVMARQIGDGFKSQLPLLISKLMTCTSVRVQPHICQCFRRILKGTGNFLTGSIGEICQFISKKVTSESEPLCVECVRTVPVLFSQGGIELSKLIPIVKQCLGAPSHVLRYATAKSVAKLLRALPVAVPTKCFDEPMAMATGFLESERQVKCVAATFPIFLRYYQPLAVVEHAKMFAGYLISFANLPVSLGAMALLSNTLMDGLVRTAGDTICLPICTAILDAVKGVTLTAGLAVVALCSVMRYCVSTEVYAAAGVAFYPLLITNRREIRRLALHFFMVMAHNEHQTARRFFHRFADFLHEKAETAAVEDVDGFSQAIASLIVSGRCSYENVLPLAVQWLDMANGRCINSSFLLFAAIYKRAKAMPQEHIAAAMKAAANRLPTADRDFLKFVSCFLLQVLLKPCQSFEDYHPVFVAYANRFLASIEVQSTTSIVLFWRIIRLGQFIWSKVNNLPLLMARHSIQLVTKMLTPEIAETIHPYNGVVDVVGTLYHVDVAQIAPKRIDHTVKTWFDYVIDTSASVPVLRCVSLMKEVLNDFPTWVSLVSDVNEKSALVTELFSGLQTRPLQMLALIRYLLSRKKITKFLPANGLPLFMSFESQSVVIARYAAFCVGKWLKLFPSLIPGCLSYLERQERNQNFVAFVLSECARIIDDPIRCLMKLHQMLQNQHMTTSLNAMLSYLKYGKIDASFKGLTDDVLLECCFSDKLRYIPALYLCVKCLMYSQRIDGIVVSNFMDFDTCKNYACYLGVSLIDKVSQSIDVTEGLQRIQSMTSPPALLTASLQVSHASQDISWQFMLLQQTGSQAVTNAILKLIDTRPDTKMWTDLCKRIVINNCVPPAERQGDVRIIPTKPVMIAALEVTVKLVTKIRERFPLELNCVDDIVAIAFTGIEAHVGNIDYHCFAILTAVIRTFADIRNKDGSLLGIYTAQFHPMLVHGLDGTRSLGSVVSFCTAYIDFLEDSHDVLLSDAMDKIVDAISKLTLNSDNFVFFCRIAARVVKAPCFDKIRSKFLKVTGYFFEQVARQKASLAEVDSQLSEMVEAYLSVPESSRKIPNSAFIALLLKDLSASFSIPTVRALAVALSCSDISEEQASFGLSILASNQSLFTADSPDLLPMEPDDTDLDASTFWVVPVVEKNPCKQLLLAICKRIPSIQWREVFEYALSLSLIKPFSFASLSCLLKCAGPDISKVGPPVMAAVLEDSDVCEAFFVHLFSFVEVRVGDSVLSFIARSSLPNARKFAMIRAGLRHFGSYNLVSLKDIARLASSDIVPDGMTFVSSLLVDPATVNIALNFLPLGILEGVVNAMVQSMRSLPRIMHFLGFVYEKVIQAGVNSPEFQRALCSVVFAALRLTSGQSDRTPVVAPALKILRMIDTEILRTRWELEKYKQEIVDCLTPPKGKSSNSIELKLFSGTRTRKLSAGGGWQSLESED